ncbi:PspA/IM30 family protein [Paenibacillus daejeonensis]|uniref:PspA/IM30 family protein n=1 Tax=Paenibacillus daejeonensis TaxID=135193 RepID=UPI00037CB961|nr:PspA/IM30 family protein [Paenibacillus daejeonensis]
MSIFKRLGDMTRASLNEALDRVEDPVIMLNQYLRDMEQEIFDAERTVAKQMASERMTKQRADQAAELAASREQAAEQALRDGNEELARQLLEEKLGAEKQAADFGQRASELQSHTEQLQGDLERMRDEFVALKSKRQELASRAEAAKATKQLSQVSSQPVIQAGGASRGFSRMEEKIMQLEAEAAVSRSTGYSSTYSGTTQTYVDPSTQLKVDEQLEALKRKVNN